MKNAFKINSSRRQRTIKDINDYYNSTIVDYDEAIALNKNREYSLAYVEWKKLLTSTEYNLATFDQVVSSPFINIPDDEKMLLNTIRTIREDAQLNIKEIENHMKKASRNASAASHSTSNQHAHRNLKNKRSVTNIKASTNYLDISPTTSQEEFHSASDLLTVSTGGSRSNSKSGVKERRSTSKLSKSSTKVSGRIRPPPPNISNKSTTTSSTEAESKISIEPDTTNDDDLWNDFSGVNDFEITPFTSEDTDENDLTIILPTSTSYNNINNHTITHGQITSTYDGDRRSQSSKVTDPNRRSRSSSNITDRNRRSSSSSNITDQHMRSRSSSTSIEEDNVIIPTKKTIPRSKSRGNMKHVKEDDHPLLERIFLEKQSDTKLTKRNDSSTPPPTISVVPTIKTKRSVINNLGRDEISPIVRERSPLMREHIVREKSPLMGKHIKSDRNNAIRNKRIVSNNHEQNDNSILLRTKKSFRKDDETHMLKEKKSLNLLNQTPVLNKKKSFRHERSVSSLQKNNKPASQSQNFDEYFETVPVLLKSKQSFIRDNTTPKIVKKSFTTDDNDTPIHLKKKKSTPILSVRKIDNRYDENIPSILTHKKSTPILPKHRPNTTTHKENIQISTLTRKESTPVLSRRKPEKIHDESTPTLLRHKKSTPILSKQRAEITPNILKQKKSTPILSKQRSEFIKEENVSTMLKKKKSFMRDQDLRHTKNLSGHSSEIRDKKSYSRIHSAPIDTQSPFIDYDSSVYLVNDHHGDNYSPFIDLDATPEIYEISDHKPVLNKKKSFVNSQGRSVSEVPERRRSHHRKHSQHHRSNGSRRHMSSNNGHEVEMMRKKDINIADGVSYHGQIYFPPQYEIDYYPNDTRNRPRSRNEHHQGYHRSISTTSLHGQYMSNRKPYAALTYKDNHGKTYEVGKDGHLYEYWYEYDYS